MKVRDTSDKSPTKVGRKSNEGSTKVQLRSNCDVGRMSIALASNATSDDMAASDTMVSNYGGTAT